MDSINWEGQKMEISTKIFWCRDVHVFFCKKVPSRLFLFCLVTTWFRIWHIGAWRGMCRGLHWKLITHTFVPTLAWINFHPWNYLCVIVYDCADLLAYQEFFAQITPPPAPLPWLLFSRLYTCKWCQLFGNFTNREEHKSTSQTFWKLII